MKISKALFGIDLLLAGGWAQATSLMDKARSKAAGTAGTRNLEGLRGEVPTSRELHPSTLLTTCALPCSWGSCSNFLTDWDNYNPWCTLCSDEPQAQTFTFTLLEGTEYRINVNRDKTQCMMDPAASLHDATGEEVGCGDDENAIQGCGLHGDPEIIYTPTKKGKFTLKVYSFNSDMPCPREGYKFSVFVHPTPVVKAGFTRDPSCGYSPQHTIAKGSGKFTSPPGAFPHVEELESEGTLTFDVKYEDEMALKPVGSLDLGFTEGSFFNSTDPKWLFTNQKQGCTRVHGSGTVADGHESLFDLIVFDKTDSHQLIVHDRTTDPAAPASYPDQKRWLYSLAWDAVKLNPKMSSRSICTRTGTHLSNPDFVEDLCSCEGHCESNWDCVGDLVCFQDRRGKNAVPGCTGRKQTGVNYCVEPTANTCEEEDKEALFLYTKKGKSKPIKCAVLQRKLTEGNRGQKQVADICAQTESGLGFGPAKDVCQITCQTCRSQCEGYSGDTPEICMTM